MTIAWRRTRRWFGMLLVGALAGTTLDVGAAELAGKARILDGRSLMVGGRQVMLYGIDAPDLDQVCRRAGQDYQCGKVARAALWDLVAGLDVACQPAEDGSSGPEVVVAHCTAGGFNLSQNMVYTGWALADRDVTDDFVAVEKESKKAGRGLWSGEFEPPWEWRQKAQ